MAERHISDFTKTSNEIIINLINHDNGLALTPEKVDLINLVAVPESKQVQVTVSSKLGSGYRGTQDVTYNRLFLNEIPGSENAGELEFDIAKLSDVLTFINVGFGVNINIEDAAVNDTDLELSDPEVTQEYDVSQDFKITAKDGNLVWMGELTFTLTKIRSALSDIWQVTNLDGLYPPINWPDTAMSTDTDGDMRQRPDGSFRVLMGV